MRARLGLPFALDVSIRIPRTSQSRGEKTYALLVQCVRMHHPFKIFDGLLFRTGSHVDEAELRPSPEYPEIPVLIEYAGRTHPGAHQSGSRRYAHSIHVLWRFDPARKEFMEISRVLSQGPEWKTDLAPMVMRYMTTRVINHVEVAHAATARVLKLLDSELDEFEDNEGRARMMSFLYDQFTARLVDPTNPSRYF